MTVSLDTVVAETVYLVKTLEKAVHDPGHWTMTFGGRTVDAQRMITGDGVLFVAEFGERTLVPIEMTQGMTAWVSPEDADLVGRHSWSVATRGEKIYAQARIGGKNVLMHTLLMNPPEGVGVDHVDGDTLDNRRSNLRLASKSQNAANRGPTKSNTSGYKGVHWHKQGKKWMAAIGVDGKSIYLGLFQHAQDAARAYDEAALKHFGEYAVLNFPPPDPKIVLACDNHPVAVKAIIFPGDGAFQVRWGIRAQRVPASALA